MKHVVKLSTPPAIDRIDRQEVIQIRCGIADIAKLVMALCLLREGLIEAFVIVGSKGAKLVISQNEEKAPHAAVKRSSEKIEIALPLVSIDMVLHFYLVYYRDGFADVSHVDIETDGFGSGGYLTFFAAESKPPLTVNDLEEHLRKTE